MPRQFKLLGRGGMVYNDGQEEYYIDTDNMIRVEDKALYKIYCRDIRLLNKGRMLTNEERKEIAITIKTRIEEMGRSKVEVLP